MSQATLFTAPEYPESDGKPMADNMTQLRWIVVLYGNLTALYRDDPNVFVGSNQFWFPVEHQSKLRQAPDVYVVFGRPKGDRPSYKQWEEDNVPMTVTFEILSPENDAFEMADKLAFYDEHGVEEYYVYDPYKNRLLVYLRGKASLRRTLKVDGLVSPKLGVRFDLSGPEMVVYRPDGRRFLSFEELDAEREQERQRADQERQRADQEHQRADQERQLREAAEQRLARLLELSRKARRGQATPEELAELEQLEQPLPPV